MDHLWELLAAWGSTLALFPWLFVFNNCCCKCLTCDTEDWESTVIEVIVSGVVNGGCSPCAALNDTFILELYEEGVNPVSGRDQATCAFRYGTVATCPSGSQQFWTWQISFQWDRVADQTVVILSAIIFANGDQLAFSKTFSGRKDCTDFSGFTLGVADIAATGVFCSLGGSASAIVTVIAP